MQTFKAYFLKEEFQEVKDAIATLDNVEIISETQASNTLLEVTIMASDVSILYSVGLLVQYKRMQLIMYKAFNQ